MAGTFAEESLPALSGSFHRFEAATDDPPPISRGATVMLASTHDWGPVDQTGLFRSLGEWEAVYGASDTEARRAVRSCFVGEGLPGKGGAGAIIFRRQATDAATAATASLPNTEEAEIGLVLTALHPGTRGDALRWEVVDGENDGEQELRILDGTRILESYVHDEDDMAALAADIVANSDWLSNATVDEDGHPLAVGSGAFTGGNDGTSLTSGDYLATLGAIEYEPFGVLAFPNLTDGPTTAAVAAWTLDLNARGRKHVLVVGGAIDETYSTAATRSGTLDSEKIVNLGVGRIGDQVMSPGQRIEISTAQAAPRVAGAIAARGEYRDLIYCRFAGWDIVSGVTRAQEEQAADDGLCVLVRDGSQAAPVMIRDGVTTYQGNDPDKPLSLYKSVKFERVRQGIETDFTIADEQGADGTGGPLGDAPVDGVTRDYLLGARGKLIDDRIKGRILLPGSYVELDPSYTPDDDDDFVRFKVHVVYTRTLRQAFYVTVER